MEGLSSGLANMEVRVVFCDMVWCRGVLSKGHLAVQLVRCAPLLFTGYGTWVNCLALWTQLPVAWR